jgi:hypothetical protein
MSRFEVFASATLIGYSELDRGDPPMGVASGRFLPLPAYEGIQALVIASRNGLQTHLALTVRTADGQDIPAQGGVQINDYSSELRPEDIEVDVLGIGYPLYEDLFPGRYATYAAGFRKEE